MTRRPTASLNTKPFLSVEETALLVGESRATLYRAIQRGDFPLPVVRLGARLRVPRRAVERLLEGLPPVESTARAHQVSGPVDAPQDEVDRGPQDAS